MCARCDEPIAPGEPVDIPRPTGAGVTVIRHKRPCRARIQTYPVPGRESIGH